MNPKSTKPWKKITNRNLLRDLDLFQEILFSVTADASGLCYKEATAVNYDVYILVEEKVNYRATCFVIYDRSFCIT